RTRGLVRQIDGPVPPNEILVPAHASVGCSFPSLAAEAASVNHDDWNVPIAVWGDLILHVHLIDRNLASARDDGRARRWRECLRFAADEKTALAGNHEGFLEIVSPFRVFIFVLSETRYRYRDGEKQNRFPM